jgi:hypothetical protein
LNDKKQKKTGERKVMLTYASWRNKSAINSDTVSTDKKASVINATLAFKRKKNAILT